jgi:hypothetical protein
MKVALRSLLCTVGLESVSDEFRNDETENGYDEYGQCW